MAQINDSSILTCRWHSRKSERTVLKSSVAQNQIITAGDPFESRNKSALDLLKSSSCTSLYVGTLTLFKSLDYNEYNHTISSEKVEKESFSQS